VNVFDSDWPSSSCIRQRLSPAQRWRCSWLIANTLPWSSIADYWQWRSEAWNSSRLLVRISECDSKNSKCRSGRYKLSSKITLLVKTSIFKKIGQDRFSNFMSPRPAKMVSGPVAMNSNESGNNASRHWQNSAPRATTHVDNNETTSKERNRLAPSRSTVNGMWSRISTKIGSNTKHIQPLYTQAKFSHWLHLVLPPGESIWIYDTVSDPCCMH